ncbi:glycoside hydrolase family 28 protein [Bipolaris oryzae ATCC 44560]|uniref:endo-polygalacturonase n=1 Tax=Bipolaris oryzae ATCC 44560 TaxID=930090 RepID=W6ZFC5_COCMI|nr:glycoside hydrolase family 28 protein [Bipolaris oryzae ATCC 44560]EUC48613.1 glycoside hydrolase family 28 protein [Bipolaris oryzae ATCC 44560]
MLGNNLSTFLALLSATQVTAVPSNCQRRHPPPPPPPPNPICHVTQYTQIPAAVASCTHLTLDNIRVPGNRTIDLSKLQRGSKVTFAGTTFWEYAAANYPFIKVSGTDIEVTAAPFAVLNGNGPAWWDGLGSNGGRIKPNHFIEVKNVTGCSTIHDIYIKNYPVHCFSITNSQDLDVYRIRLDNAEGYAANNVSNGLAAAHNSDGFGVSSSKGVRIRDSVVVNQDDCVAVTSGDGVVVDNMWCNGSHGLSIGSVGGKSNNIVNNISFTNSFVLNAENGARIKSNSNTTGSITNILFKNIFLENISIYGIDIQQDYLNGGPTGKPTNGVKIQNITMQNIRGTATDEGRNYYILCGEGSCSDFTFNNIHVVGGGKSSLCNFRTKGNFDCDGKFVS